ncbi:hypothetical protein TcWFU_005961 [Taenia crassiceps]|uniref:Uncharacterized protein n=1 Tax=Taenia crassiceps TaxID=6207 RepID=A0ABR4QLF3_9CEST
MPKAQSVGLVDPAVIEMPPIRRLPRFAVSPCVNKRCKKMGRRVYSQPDFQKEVETKVSTENLRSMADTPPKNETPTKGTSTQALDAVQRCQGGSPRPKQVEDNERGGRSASPPQDMLSIIRCPSPPPLQKTFHAPKSNQTCSVSTARTFNPERIDALIATLAEKLTNLRARSETIAYNVDYTSRLLREIRALDSAG